MKEYLFYGWEQADVLVINEEYKGCQTAAVKFIDYDDNLFRKYVATGEYLDKAGSYAIQGRAAALIESIDFFRIFRLDSFIPPPPP